MVAASSVLAVVMAPSVTAAQLPIVPPGSARNGGAHGDPIRVERASLRQHGFAVTLQIRLTAPLRRSDLTARGRQLCAYFRGSTSSQKVVPVCLLRRGTGVRRRDGHGRLTIKHRDISLLLAYRSIGGHPGIFRWRLGTEDRACERTQGVACFTNYPRRTGRLRLVQPRAVGCQRHGSLVVTAAPAAAGKRIALTFDDGPGPATPRVLRILQRFHVHATFFQLGQEVRGHASLERRLLAAGDQLANHSYSHPMLPSRSQLRATSTLIEHDTGYRPCLFRPPYGALDRRLEDDARSLGMTSVVWNVDPRDWSTPGTRAIESRVLHATRAGSIILMHDGGGPRGQTVAALPTILRTLKRRGYQFQTVSQLLHYRTNLAPR